MRKLKKSLVNFYAFGRNRVPDICSSTTRFTPDVRWYDWSEETTDRTLDFIQRYRSSLNFLLVRLEGRKLYSLIYRFQRLRDRDTGRSPWDSWNRIHLQTPRNCKVLYCPCGPVFLRYCLGNLSVCLIQNSEDYLVTELCYNFYNHSCGRSSFSSRPLTEDGQCTKTFQDVYRTKHLIRGCRFASIY